MAERSLEDREQDRTTGLGRIFDDTCQRGVLRALILADLLAYLSVRALRGREEEEATMLTATNDRSRRLFHNEVPTLSGNSGSRQERYRTPRVGASHDNNH